MRKLLPFIFLFLLGSCREKEESIIPTSEPMVPISNLRLFGPDGGKILSGETDKKWQILRLYQIESSDLSTVQIENIGLLDNNLQTDLLANVSDNLKTAKVIFKTGPTGTSGYGGISNGSFEVQLQDGSRFLNQEGKFEISGVLTPYYKTSFGKLFQDIKIIPTLYTEDQKLIIGNQEYKGEFLQIVNCATDEEKATVLLLHYPV